MSAESAAKIHRIIASVFFAWFVCIAAPAFAQTGKPEKLQCESLTSPLGVDVDHPRLSWRLRDSRYGAKQTAYQIQVASSANLLLSDKPDIWDSGKIPSDKSIDVAYGGRDLQVSTRYFWRVKVWDHEGKPYPPSDVAWWETGLLEQKNWSAKWICYEIPEMRAVRNANAEWITNPETIAPKTERSSIHNFRFRFQLPGEIRHAALYVTGRDSAAAWVNGNQVLEAQPLPPWRQMPWKTYFVKEITKELKTGENVLAVGITRHHFGRQANANDAQTPMSMTLYAEFADGSTKVFTSKSEGWRATLEASGEWMQSGFDDSNWKAPIAYVPPPNSFDGSDIGDPWPTDSVMALRKNFDVSKKIASARIYATALGAYKLSLNGQEVGDEILSPGWTDYRERVIYQTYDVTSQLKPGKNAIGALLAPGWYATPLQWYRQGNNYGKTPPALRAQLRIRYEDGSVEWIATDGSWKADVSPIVFAEIYDGETYDSRKVQSGWNTAPFDDAKWNSVQLVEPKEPEIVWQYFPPIREHQVLPAKSVTNPSAGVYIFDFGQNLSGVAKIRAKGSAGTDVRLRFAEIVNDDGTIYTENLRTAKATDYFILSGKGIEEFAPKFTFHGFRYVEVSGLAAKPELSDVKAVVYHTDAPFTAALKTGSAMVNQLWNNILWGQRSNFVGVPTDCPQRDERLGWSADAQVFWRTATFNMDLAAFSRKFGADLRGTQVGTYMYGIFAPGTNTPNPGFGTGWSDAGVIIPWTSWIQNGDRKSIEENWSAMEKYLAAIEAQNPDHLWKKGYGIPFADWLSPEGVTPVDLIATAYWAYNATLMREMAHAIGNSEGEKKYDALFQKIRDAFYTAYAKPDGWVGGVPPPPVFASATETKLSEKPVETQTGYVLALQMDLLPPAVRPLAAQRLVDRIAANHWRLGTGFLGTPYLLSALTDTGHADAAYRLLLSTEYPSWGYLVEHGATTMWERWNGDQMKSDPSMNSYNHYAYGAVGDWIYRYAAGVDTVPEDPGFHTIWLHPNFDARLGSVDFSYDSVYGTIHSAWTVTGKKATWNVTIPPNTVGRLRLAADEHTAYQLDGKPLAESRKVVVGKGVEGKRLFDIAAGTYQFEVALP
ncbi:MAG TPA: family 78 glycoside hydrolase catalytic domain [Candidatus Acidoferrum sp.]|nr:family 78 glycoside hydrolase catalytic domain [Candidatus Acidoferrum sp.]